MRRRARGHGGGYLFLAPYLLLFFLFVLLPALMGLWMSLHDWAYLGQRRWAGLANYARLFDAQGDVGYAFWQSVRNTGLFVLFSVPLLVVLPLGIALVMNARVPGRTFFRATFFAPSLLGIAVVGVLWRYLLDPQGGLVNAYLGRPVPWTTELPWAWGALVGVTLWWTLGFNAVIYLAGLQDIPRELYEAARLDGAGRWARFRHVTLPGLRPVLVLVATTTLLASANMFGQAYLVTAGAPAHATRTAVMYIAQEGLRAFQLGQAAAMSFVLALLLAALGLATRRLLRPEVR